VCPPRLNHTRTVNRVAFDNDAGTPAGGDSPRDIGQELIDGMEDFVDRIAAGVPLEEQYRTALVRKNDDGTFTHHDLVPPAQGLTFAPHFCPAGADPYTQVEWAERTAEIANSKGKVVWSQPGVRFPTHFDKQAVDVVANKYFYGDSGGGSDPAEGGREHDLQQVVSRITDTIADWGIEDRVFASIGDELAFRNDLAALLLGQYACFNSPVLFNVGLWHKYGICGSTRSWHWDPFARQVVPVEDGDSLKYAQASACFILGMEDTMESILDRVKAEGTLFKHGSGAGSDNSCLRSTHEKLSGGGRPSGPVSFMRLFDAVGAVVTSGGRTRRAAKMEILRCDHPDIEEFINCKRTYEDIIRTLVKGGYSADFNAIATRSTAYQNANHSVRATDAFMAKWADGDPDDDWQTLAVTTGTPIGNNGKRMPNYSARSLGRQIAQGTWECGDPGVQFDDQYQRWHTTPKSGRIWATNPCAEFAYLNDTSCNLASVNLIKFLRADGTFDSAGFRAACARMITAQEILVDHASYPTEKIARNSHRFRPLGLGYTNLGGLVMVMGLAYDSDEGRALAGAITAIMHGQAYLQSAEMARVLGPFDGYAENRDDMLRVMGQHAAAVENGYMMAPVFDDARPNPLLALWAEARTIWGGVLEAGETYGFRNSQVTVLAPTGTISFWMDADTTGVEPETALVKYKNLDGGGQLKIVNRLVPRALQTLGYEPYQVNQIIAHVAKYDTIEDVEVIDGMIARSGLQPEHLPVFDCAFQAERGTRSIHYSGHIKMLSAVQPFISGSCSKTINLPKDATVEDIEQAYFLGWRLGLKAMAIYRDGSKGAQPLTTSSGVDKPAEPPPVAAAVAYLRPEANERRNGTGPASVMTIREADPTADAAMIAAADAIVGHPAPAAVLPPPLPDLGLSPDDFEAIRRELEATLGRPVGPLTTAAPAGHATGPPVAMVGPPLFSSPGVPPTTAATWRAPLPDEIDSRRFKVRIGGHKVYMHVGYYPDGRVGEVFFTGAKEGSTVAGLLDAVAKTASLGFQYGVPVAEAVALHGGTKYEPLGGTSDPDIGFAQSLTDGLFRKLGATHPGGRRRPQEALPVPKAPQQGPAPGDAQAAAGGPPGAQPGGNGAARPAAVPRNQGDAPVCDRCGNVMERAGACFRCRCGESSGCG
jgi:ribonucleoside-diphosphate reductase alpha chain